MLRKGRKLWALAGAALGIGLGAGAPALADVNAGVADWGKGNYAGAVKEWQGPADKGDAVAQYNLAQAYKWGMGVPQDLTRAEMLFARAAAQGHLAAADNYGLLLFQRGQHAQAMPYIKTAADHGEPRAQYLLGVAYFNGENVPRDWVRAYALESLANQTGLPQAKAALTQMDQYIPLDQRQKGISLASEMAGQVEANRSRADAAQSLGTPMATPLGAPQPMMQTSAPATAAAPPPAEARQELAAAPTPARRPLAMATPAAAGQIKPAPVKPVAAKPAAPKPAAAKAALPKPETPKAETPKPGTPAPEARKSEAPKPAPAAGSAHGEWKLQLGAFGVPANADALWAKIKGRPEIAGHARQNLPTGKVTRLMATGYSEEAAHAACARLTGAGFACLPARN